MVYSIAMASDKQIFEKVYETPGAGWTQEAPPAELVDIIKGGQVSPCKAIDIGCGEGFYSIYLASKKFDVLGIDLSGKAIEIAAKNAIMANSTAGFMQMDIKSLLVLVEMGDLFDFALEWSMLHHIHPMEREAYIGDLSRIINKGGKYLATCFNDQSVEAGGRKEMVSPIGTKLYYSSQDELVDLYSPHFNIIEQKLFDFEAPKGVTHTHNYFFMERK